MVIDNKEVAYPGGEPRGPWLTIDLELYTYFLRKYVDISLLEHLKIFRMFLGNNLV